MQTQDVVFGLTTLDITQEKVQTQLVIFYKNHKFLTDVESLVKEKMQVNLASANIKTVAVP